MDAPSNLQYGTTRAIEQTYMPSDQARRQWNNFNKNIQSWEMPTPAFEWGPYVPEFTYMPGLAPYNPPSGSIDWNNVPQPSIEPGFWPLPSVDAGLPE